MSTIDLTVGTGDYTLTTANGSPDEARRAILKFTGAATVARNIIVPSQTKLYVVHNKVTNNFAMTVKTASGAGVAVAQNATAFVYCDGVDVFSVGANGALLAANNLSDLTNVPTARTNLDVYSKAETTALIAAVASGLYVGEVRMWTTATAPTKWLICDGTEVSRTTYATLFGVIGTTYGAGNGTTTFTLPNFKGRSPVGAGQGNTAQGGGLGTNRALGVLGGAEGHVLVTAELASHFHAAGTYTGVDAGHYHFVANTSTSSENIALTGSNFIAQANASGTYTLKSSSSSAAPTLGRTSTAQGSSVTISGSSASTGSDASHNNMHPFQGINFIIYSGV